MPANTEAQVSESPSLTQILQAVDRLAGMVQAQQAEIAELKGAQPKVVKMNRPVETRPRNTYTPPEQLRAQAMQRLGRDGRAYGRLGLLDDPKNVQALPPEYRPIFVVGDLVLVNPDAKVHGSDQTWAEVMERLHRDDPMEGEVMGVMYISDTWEPKYKVHVPGLTPPNGDGFYESELLPA